jgi:hypothetical protein
MSASAPAVVLNVHDEVRKFDTDRTSYTTQLISRSAPSHQPAISFSLIGSGYTASGRSILWALSIKPSQSAHNPFCPGTGAKGRWILRCITPGGCEYQHVCVERSDSFQRFLLIIGPADLKDGSYSIPATKSSGRASISVDGTVVAVPSGDQNGQLLIRS